ncbi:hypothetical protein HAX54_004180 [Datura stramonium]|uniref:Uncharacterized protein n=1 Tax=Datura stramonium TaxID=4076 RepID=A0ABS8T6J1_DATST|nr:hypothetical protein [Datura stramonium]
MGLPKNLPSAHAPPPLTTSPLTKSNPTSIEGNPPIYASTLIDPMTSTTNPNNPYLIKARRATYNGLHAIIFKSKNYYGAMTSLCRRIIVERFSRITRRREISGDNISNHNEKKSGSKLEASKPPTTMANNKSVVSPRNDKSKTDLKEKNQEDPIDEWADDDSSEDSTSKESSEKETESSNTMEGVAYAKSKDASRESLWGYKRSPASTLNQSWDFGLEGIGFSDNRYTWYNKRKEEAIIWKSLDRVVVNDKWCDMFPGDFLDIVKAH